MSWQQLAIVLAALLLSLGTVQAQSRGSQRAEANRGETKVESREKAQSRSARPMRTEDRARTSRDSRTKQQAADSKGREDKNKSSKPERRTNNDDKKNGRQANNDNPQHRNGSSSWQRHDSGKPNNRDRKHEDRRWTPPVHRRPVPHHPSTPVRSRYWWHVHPRHVNHGGSIGIGFYIRLPIVDWFWRAPKRRFVYRQVLYTDVYGRARTAAGLDIRTTFERQVRRVYDDRTEVDFEIRSIEIWDGPRLVGFVDHMPGNLRRVRATIYRDGYVDFDRMVYVLGDWVRGFEVVSLRYHGIGANAAFADLDVRAGVVDFGRREVRSISVSRNLALIDAGLIPNSLIPQDEESGLRFAIDADGTRYTHSYTLGSLSDPNVGVETRQIFLSRID